MIDTFGELRTKDGKPSLENLEGHRVEATIERWIGRPGRNFRKIQTTYTGDVLWAARHDGEILFVTMNIGRKVRVRRYIYSRSISGFPHDLISIRVLDLEEDLPKICTSCGKPLDADHDLTD